MSTYFDNREGRTKTIPDCSKVGCVWNESTQRCELMSYPNNPSLLSGVSPVRDLRAIGRASGTNRGLGFAEDYYYEDEHGNWYYEDASGGYWGDSSGGYWDSAGSYYDPNSGTYYDASAGGSDSYIETPDGAWSYDDGNGNTYSGDPYGNYFWEDANTGESIQVGADGSYYWVDANGEYYYEDANGNWTWANANGQGCSGDASGNGTCTDGTSFGSVSQSPASSARDKAQAARGNAQSGGGGASGGGSQAAKQAAQQAAKALTSNPNAPRQPGLFSSSDTKTLLYVGIGLAALMLIKK